jgi:hypothetical protein
MDRETNYYEVHWAAANHSDQVCTFRRGAKRHRSEAAARQEARSVNPPNPFVVPIVTRIIVSP